MCRNCQYRYDCSKNYMTAMMNVGECPDYCPEENSDQED